MEVEQQPPQRSLADALARNKQTWNGKEPADAAPETPEPESPEPPAPEATETIPSPPAEPEPPRLKYKSHEEAERAYEEAERRMHEATREAARYREDVERMQREREAKPPEPTPAAPPAQTSVKQLEDGLKQMYAIQREYEIDGNEEALYAKSAEIWRESFGSDPKLRGIFEAQARQIVKEQFEQEWTTRQAQVRVEQDQRTEQEKLVAFAADRAQQSGVDIVGDREAQRLFWGYAAEEVDALFPEASYEQRIDEAIKIVSRLKPPQPVAAAPPADAGPEPPTPTEPTRRPPQPMGRQSGAPVGVPTGEGENSDRRPVTLEEALQKTHRAQRL